MYGTVARFRVKPGSDEKVREMMRSYEQLKVPGHVNTVVYRMDTNPNEYYMAVVFQDKDTYTKNANSPDQDARYREFIAFLEGEPEWHDGEIVYEMT
jgi:quinol monooxygenase YgiN